MKIALCLFGVIGNSEEKASHSRKRSEDILKLAHKSYKEHFLDKYDVDVFVHTWSVDYQRQIEKLYKPVSSSYQKQKTFSTPEYVSISSQYRKDSNRILNHYSRWYSTKQVIALKKIYELEKDFTYDFVFVTRFDLSFSKGINFDLLSKNKFYSAPACYNVDILGRSIANRLFLHTKNKSYFPIFFHRHKKFDPNKSGLPDLWFVSGSEIMDKFSLLFDMLDSYLKDMELSSHRLVVRHLKSIKEIDNLSFIMHRFRDFALVRRKYFLAKK